VTLLVAVVLDVGVKLAHDVQATQSGPLPGT
jgi:hypothetical protein